MRRWADAVAQPWRNGGGVTRELVSAPEGEPDFDWRISIADITAAGAFSQFPGVDRTIVVLGPELELVVDGAEHALVAHRPFAFDGGLAVSCSLPSGPTRALNVMTRERRCRADVDVVHPASAPRSRGAAASVVIALAGPVSVALAADEPITLGRFDVCVVPPGADLSLSGDGLVALVGIRRGVDARTTGAPTGP